MIVRTASCPISNGDVEVGSLVTVLTENNELNEYMIIKILNASPKKPFAEGLKVESCEMKGKDTIFLYANKIVCLNKSRKITVPSIQRVQARLAWDIVENIIREEAEFQKQAKKRLAKAAKAKSDKGFVPKDSTNTAWGSLGNATKGYIKIYRG